MLAIIVFSGDRVGYHTVLTSRLYQTKMTGQHVAVLLCTYNGEKYVRQQIASIIAQTHTDWSLWVSDDGSGDRTLEIIRECMENQQQPLRIMKGPSKGSTQNFLSLLNSDALFADYYAFSDQDDIWYPEKIERGLNWHLTVQQDRPSLYGARTRHIDEKGNSLGLSASFRKKPAFPNALVQCIAGGNTMIFNERARKLVRLFKDCTDVTAHDWWLYILVTASGGNVCYDPVPVLDYRQHGANLVGSNIGISANFLRVKKLAKGLFREWTEKHLILLDKYPEVLAPENRIILQYFKKTRHKSLFKRIQGILKSGIYRQTLLGHIGILAAVVFRKI